MASADPGGQELRKKRNELTERSFAHCYDPGGMRRTHLRDTFDSLAKEHGAIPEVVEAIMGHRPLGVQKN